jgi:hypothetical protein
MVLAPEQELKGAQRDAIKTTERRRERIFFNEVISFLS